MSSSKIKKFDELLFPLKAKVETLNVEEIKKLDIEIEHNIVIKNNGTCTIEQSRKKLSMQIFNNENVEWKDITSHLLLGIAVIHRTIRITNGIEELHV